MVAKDIGTTIIGIQTAITLYTLVMAALMVTGGKIGADHRPQARVRDRLRDLRRRIADHRPLAEPRRAALGWSFLEGVGAWLILPAIVALVALNFGQERRPRAYGLVASAAAIAIAVGPIVGGRSPPTSRGATSSPARS